MKKLIWMVAAAMVACAGGKEEARKDSQTAGDAAAGAKQAAGEAATAVKEKGAEAATAVKEKDAAPKLDAQAQAEQPLMPDAEFRQKAPEPLPVQPHFDAPVPKLRTLKNGARLLVTENHQIPLVAVDVQFLHGIDADPASQPGLAEFTADAADEGTKSRTASQLAEDIENIAAHLSAGAGRESTSVHLNCLTDTLDKALDLLADVIQNPAFRKEDVERVRVLKLTGLQAKRANTGALANDEANKLLFGDKHPWGQPSGGTPESVQSITPADLAKFHATWWVPNNAVISVSGDVKAAEIASLLEQKFAGWKKKALPKLKLAKEPALERGVYLIDKPGATQSQVWVVGRGIPARHPDAVPLRVANMVLGGLFTSRLNMNLREKHGYSYGVGSQFSFLRDEGTFRAAGGIVAKNTVEAVTEYEHELSTFADGKVTDDELAKAKEAFVRSLPSALETNDAVSSALAGLVSLALPLDYYQSLPGKVEKVSEADVARVVKKHFAPSKWPYVIVGPAESSRAGLEKLNLGQVAVVPIPGSSSAASGTK